MWLSRTKAIILTLGVVFASASLNAELIDDPTKMGASTAVVDKDGHVESSAVTQCCEDLTEFDNKLDNSLKVLKQGYGKVRKVHSAGEYVFYDFATKDHHIARLVVNKKLKELMLVQMEI